jgi:hypothetical protein
MKKKVIKKKTEKFQDYVKRVLKEVKRHMYLQEWTYSIVWAKEDKQTGPDMFVMAEIKTQVSYIRFDVTIYPALERKFNAGQYDDVAETLTHELCHVLTEPLYVMAYDLCAPALNDHLNVVREQQTQRTCNAVYGLLPNSIKKLKKL